MSERHQRAPFPLRVKEPTKEWLKRKAAQEDRSLNWIINNLIEAAIHREQQAETSKEEALGAATPRASEHSPNLYERNCP
ncbi:CopG family ribbon-helix-helix protein [Vreelandella olivaria]|uniref:CopG family ribbon-helix-helix protein n=1 Tax=Vreelandella olivaria TaxID=390919 RepID=UPI00201F4EC9|nr:hypothetical protein [Halomonas olivaria]